jgi:hypothetical protein
MRVEDLRNAAHIGDDTRTPARDSLEQGARAAFAMTRQTEQIACREPSGNLPRRLNTCEENGTPQVGVALNTASKIPSRDTVANQDQLQIRPPARQGAGHAEKLFHSLVSN